MGGMSDYMENAFLNEVFRNTDYTPVATVYAALHDDPPGDAGANEIAGGSYIRKAITFAAAAGGIIDSNANAEFADMPASVAKFWSVWDAAAASNMLQWGEIVADHTAPIVATAAGAAATDVFTSYGHALSDDDTVILEQSFGSALPTGVAEDAVYFVVNKAANTFELSLTEGGATIDLTADGECIARRFVAKTVNLGDTFRLPSGEVRIQAK